MDRYRSSAHLANFQFSGSLIAQSLSEKPVVRSQKRALKRKIAPKTTAVRSYVCMFYAFFNHFYSSIFEIAL